MRISTAKIRKFTDKYPHLWHEGCSEKDCRKVKESVTGKFGKLWTRFYWPLGKSYLFQSKLDDNIFCITKKYFDSL